MSFKFPSHDNSTNERRARRANWKADVRKAQPLSVEQENERMEKLAVAIVAADYVTKLSYGYRVQVSPMNWQDVIDNGGLFCACADAGKFNDCAHLKAVKKYRFALEVAERRAQNAEAIAEQAIRDADGICFWCHNKNLFTDAGEPVACAFCDRQNSEEFHYQAGEIELHYENSGYFEAA